MSNYKEYFLSKGIVIIFLFFSISATISCTQKMYGQPVNYDFRSKNNFPDYSDLDYWAASPFKEDPSDEVPKDLNEFCKRFAGRRIFYLPDFLYRYKNA